MPVICRAVLIGAGVVACLSLLAERTIAKPAQTIRTGKGLIVAVRNGSSPGSSENGGTASTATTFPHPSPRLAGFQPFVAITTSSKTSNVDIDYEHKLEAGYDCLQAQGPGAFPCGALNPPASQNFIVGILDSGSVSDLVAQPFSDTVGLFGSFVTTNIVPISGIGGSLDANVTLPVGYYVAGLSAVTGLGQLDLSRVVGHSNSAGLVAPPIVCGDSFAVTGLIGNELLSFYTTLINVDTPRRITLEGFTYKGPDVRIQDPLAEIPFFPHSFALEFGGLSPVSTASYFPDVEDLETPAIPTLLSFPLSIPTGGAFFATVQLRQGPPSSENLPTPVELMLDTGSQASVISRAVAANLSLPINPDFVTEACGISGDVTTVPGYYIDYVKINALGGALEFSHAPFLVEDLPSPAGGVMDGILGMNFFWDRNVAFEPSLTESSFFEVSDPIPFAFGDYDADRFVDLDDMFFWSACQTAPGGEVTPDCVQLDGDGDGTVDLKDFAGLQRCFNGSDEQADPACGF